MTPKQSTQDPLALVCRIIARSNTLRRDFVIKASFKSYGAISLPLISTQGTAVTFVFVHFFDSGAF